MTDDENILIVYFIFTTNGALLDMRYPWVELDTDVEGIYDMYFYYYRYDDKGNIIYWYDNEGYKEWREYDENNRLISIKNNNNFIKILRYWRNMK